MPTNWLTGFWGRFVVADKTVDVVKNMSIVGLVTALVGSYFQYTSWREEQNIARYKEDFAAATSAFADTSNLLTAAVNTQQILFFSFKFALDAKVEADKDAFLTKSGRAAYKDYVDARLAFRKASDLLARKMEIYIDWPSNPYRDPASATSLGIDPISRNALLKRKFDCRKDLPDYRTIDTLQPVDINGLTVDWRSAKHHIITLYTCFEEAHSKINLARRWGAETELDPDGKTSYIAKMDETEELLDFQVMRLHAFMVLTMRRIEDIRLRYQTKNYFCHVFNVRRWCA